MRSTEPESEGTTWISPSESVRSTLKNPLIAASGCFGYGVEYADIVDLAVARRRRRQGPVPGRARRPPAAPDRRDAGRHAERHRPAGHRRPPLHRREAARAARARRDGHRQRLRDDARRIRRGGPDPLGRRRRRGHRAEHLVPEHQGRRHHVRLQPDRDVRRRQRRAEESTRLPIIPKLTPNVTDVASFARASEEAGADAVSLVNTFLAMVIDVESRRPKISNIVGGLSGPAIRPIAVRMVYECRQAVKIPIIGMGGIADARDALEFMIAGASAVQVGTANFVDPFIWPKLLDGITSYMERHRIERIVGSGRHAWTSAPGTGNGSAPSRARCRDCCGSAVRSPTNFGGSSADSRSAAACSPATGPSIVEELRPSRATAFFSI